MEKAFLFLSIFLLLSCSEGKYREAMNLFEQGKAQEERGVVDSAVITYNGVINLLEGTRNKSLYGDIYNRLGDLYLNNNLETDAFKVFQIALRYNLVLSDKTKASYSFRGMGKSYAYRLNPDSALYYHLEANKLLPEIKDSDEIANVYNNLSSDYFELSNYDFALIYITKAILFSKTQVQLDSLLANIKETGELCRKRFMQSKEYSVIRNRLKIDTILSYDEQTEYCSFLSVYFDPYIKSLQNVMAMSDDDCYLCCLFLIGVKTKQCANFRSITTNGLRTQKGRIFQKIKQIFGSDIIFENFFGLPEKQVKSARKNMVSSENEAEN